MVPHTILLPVDYSAKDFRAQDYAKIVSHLESKHFAAFFISDYLRIKSDASRLGRSDVYRSVESAAKKLKLDLKFITCPGSLPSLWYQSRFADLMILDLLTLDNARALNRLHAEKFFDDFGCPILLSGSLPEDQEDIIFLFDHDPSSLVALKSFLALFGEISKNKKLTVITINSSDGPGVYFEESLIHHLQQIFKNVGILPMQKTDIVSHLISFAAKATKPILIMGNLAQGLFNQESSAEALVMNKVSVYYSNK